MTVRWEKIAPIFIAALLFTALTFAFEYSNLDLFSGTACVRPYSDGRIENDRGESCYDPDLPEALVIKTRE